MEIMTQERYKEYRQQMRDQGFPMIETTVIIPTEETYKILEERIGPMPWNLVNLEKYPIKYADKGQAM